MHDYKNAPESGSILFAIKQSRCFGDRIKEAGAFDLKLTDLHVIMQKHTLCVLCKLCFYMDKKLRRDNFEAPEGFQ